MYDQEPEELTELTLAERLILANQYEILIALNADDQVGIETLQKRRRIVVDGYENHYEELTRHFNFLPAAKSKFVREVLHVNRLVFNALKDKGDVRNRLPFIGFDGNDEWEYLAYAQWQINDCGKWEEARDRAINTHIATLPRYREMLERWHELGKPSALDEEHAIELTRIVVGSSLES